LTRFSTTPSACSG